MLGIGMPELIIILVVALIVFGPKRLPDLVKSVARGMGEFKKATREIKTSLNMDEDLREIKRTFDEEMWRTMDKDNSPKADPFKSRQEEIEEQLKKHEENSEDLKEQLNGNDLGEMSDEVSKEADHNFEGEIVPEQENEEGEEKMKQRREKVDE
jgi:sec-independent protein translocase protein TatB